MKSIFLLFSILVMGSCGAKNTLGSKYPALHGTYLLTKVGEKNLNSEKFIFEFDSENNTVFGYTGCNGFSADFAQEGAEITFTSPVSTRKFCKENMGTEKRLLGAIEEIAELKREETNYVFYSWNNNPLITLTKTDERE